MEIDALVCPCCGMGGGVHDRKKRTYSCEWCGTTSVIAKSHSTVSGNAKANLDEAVKLFLSGNFESAKSMAEMVAAQESNNFTSLFIIEFYHAYIDDVKDSAAMTRVFKGRLPDFEFDVEDEDTFKDLMLHTIPRMQQYEPEILQKILDYDDPKEAAEFMEKFSPACVQLRRNLNWFTPQLANIYQQLAAKAYTPKFWMSLYYTMTKNPESPLVANDFHLKTKATRIYNDVIIPIGKIYDNIGNPEMRVKFQAGFKQVKAKFDAALQ